MRSLLIQTLLIAFWGTRATAALDCAVISDIAQMLSADVLLTQDDFGVEQHTAAKELRAFTAKYSAESFGLDLIEEVGTAAAANLGNLIAISEVAAILWEAGQFSQAAVFLRSETSRDIVDQANALVAGSSCGDFGPMQGIAANDGSSNDGASGTLQGFPRAIQLGLMGIGALALSLTVLAGVRRANAAPDLGREQRHLIDLGARLKEGSDISFVHVLDISCFGARIQVHKDQPPKTGDELSIEIDHGWATAEVRWTHAQFAGLKFTTPLTRSRLDQVMELARNRPHHAAE